MNYEKYKGEETGHPDGLSYYIHNKDGLNEIPAELSATLSERQYHFLVEYPNSLNRVITEIERNTASCRSSLIAWLQTLGSYPVELELHFVERFHKYETEEIWLRFIVTDDWKPAISLEELKGYDAYIPDELLCIYKNIGEINHYGYLSSGGLEFPGNMFTGGGILNNYTKFYSSRSGDALCYDLSGKVYHYDHETDNYEANDPDNIEYKYDMNSFVAAYFNSLMKCRCVLQ